jgi:translation initiation factor 1
MSEVCPTCGLPKDLCVCETIAKEEQRIKISTVKRKFGKLTTVIDGIDQKQINIKDLAKELKSKLACGGTAKKGRIELQGNHVSKVKQHLIELGFAADTIDTN